MMLCMNGARQGFNRSDSPDEYDSFPCKVKRYRHLQRFSILVIRHEKLPAWYIRGTENAEDLPHEGVP